MNAITPFSFCDHPVRVIDRNGQTWFSLNDVCGVLQIANPRDAAARLDDDEKDVVIIDTLGGRQESTVIDESGMYKLVLRSRKASAKQFAKFVTAEVLPSIRRTGSYGAPANEIDLSDPATLHRLLIDHTGHALAAEARAAALEPKADAFDRLTDTRGALGVREAAKALKIGQHDLTEWLERERWAYRSAPGARLQGYRERELTGLVEHKTTRIRQPDGPDKVATSLQITAKGLARIAKALGAREATPHR